MTIAVGERPPRDAAGDLAELRAQLQALDAALAAGTQAALEEWRADLRRPAFREGARNLAAYLALRAEDRTGLQRALALRGLSTLGRSEGHVRPTVGAIIATLEGRDPAEAMAAALADARENLGRHTAKLLGPPRTGRRTRILVTLEPAFGRDQQRMRELVRLGADAVRINCAHDTPEDWRAMAATARATAAAEGREVRVLMDLGGPKIRTADVRPASGTRLRAGDDLLIRRRTDAPHPETVRASCACTLPEAMEAVGAGAAVMIDDGKFAARVERIDESGLWLRITGSRPGGAKLKNDKGLNFPGAELSLSPLTERDLLDLDVVTEVADVVGYSFVQRAQDIRNLHAELARRAPNRAPLPVVAKIETALAFRNLPALIVAGAGRRRSA